VQLCSEAAAQHALRFQLDIRVLVVAHQLFQVMPNAGSAFTGCRRAVLPTHARVGIVQQRFRTASRTRVSVLITPLNPSSAFSRTPGFLS